VHRYGAADPDASPAAFVTVTAATIPFFLDSWHGSGAVEVSWYNASYMTGTFTATMDHVVGLCTLYQVDP
jgi:hypothetical protein